MAGLSIMSVIAMTKWRTHGDNERDRLHQASGCKGKWIKRSGKYGPFYGCSKWPQCRITKDIWW